MNALTKITRCSALLCVEVRGDFTHVAAHLHILRPQYRCQVDV